MNGHFLLVLTFLAGLCVGWFGNTWIQSQQRKSASVDASLLLDTEGNASSVVALQTGSGETGHRGNPLSLAETNDDSLTTGSVTKAESQGNGAEPGNLPLVVKFNSLLEARQYRSAIALLQEQAQTNESNALKLRLLLLKELGYLIKARNNNDFSDLIENYLSVYYDDIDALLLLAEFNQVNGSYLEVVNVFLLATTYAYADGDQEKVDRTFDKFVSEIDDSYTRQSNWTSLINFYTHINTSGLMTSTHQFNQAMAYLRNGNEAFAIQQFNELLTDSLVGESAAKALSSLADDAEPATINRDSSLEESESIALRKLGNQYAANLDNAQGDSVNLLIDTGASMTAVSTQSFDIINARGDAVDQGNRVFRTANGLVQAAVYAVPELRLGTYQLENTLIAVIDFGTHQEIDGLLGMNILGQFHFQIDQESLQMRLSKK